MIVYVTENWWLVPVIIIALGVAAIAGYLILIAVTERPRRRKKNKRKSRFHHEE